MESNRTEIETPKEFDITTFKQNMDSIFSRNENFVEQIVRQETGALLGPEVECFMKTQ